MFQGLTTGKIPKQVWNDIIAIILCKVVYKSKKINIDKKDLLNRIINVADSKRNGASPSGKAAGFGPAIQRFESFRPSH